MGDCQMHGVTAPALPKLDPALGASGHSSPQVQLIDCVMCAVFGYRKPHIMITRCQLSVQDHTPACLS